MRKMARYITADMGLVPSTSAFEGQEKNWDLERPCVAQLWARHEVGDFSYRLVERRVGRVPLISIADDDDLFARYYSSGVSFVDRFVK